MVNRYLIISFNGIILARLEGEISRKKKINRILICAYNSAHFMVNDNLLFTNGESSYGLAPKQSYIIQTLEGGTRHAHQH